MSSKTNKYLIFIEFLVLEFLLGIIYIASFARHSSAYNYLVNCIIWVCIFIIYVPLSCDIILFYIQIIWPYGVVS